MSANESSAISRDAYIGLLVSKLLPKESLTNFSLKTQLTEALKTVLKLGPAAFEQEQQKQQDHNLKDILTIIYNHPDLSTLWSLNKTERDSFIGSIKNNEQIKTSMRRLANVQILQKNPQVNSNIAYLGTVLALSVQNEELGNDKRTALKNTLNKRLQEVLILTPEQFEKDQQKEENNSLKDLLRIIYYASELSQLEQALQIGATYVKKVVKNDQIKKLMQELAQLELPQPAQTSIKKEAGSTIAASAPVSSAPMSEAQKKDIMTTYNSAMSILKTLTDRLEDKAKSNKKYDAVSTAIKELWTQLDAQGKGDQLQNLPGNCKQIMDKFDKKPLIMEHRDNWVMKFVGDVFHAVRTLFSNLFSSVSEKEQRVEARNKADTFFGQTAKNTRLTKSAQALLQFDTQIKGIMQAQNLSSADDNAPAAPAPSK